MVSSLKDERGKRERKSSVEVKKRSSDKVELVKLRLQGRTFEEIGNVINRTEHACRSEYGRIRRGEADVIISLKELPELRKNLPFKK